MAGLLEVVLRHRGKSTAELEQLLASEVLRVHGREKGLEVIKAMGLKVPNTVH